LIVTPFIVLAPLAGWIGDRFPKSTIIRFSSVFQLAVFLLLLLAVSMHHIYFAVGAFFLLAIQSAILSPAKVGVIKELVGKRKLGYASGMLEMFTILGILGGTIIMSKWYAARQGDGMDAWAALQVPIYVLLACTPISMLGAFGVERTYAKGARPFKPGILVEHFGQVWSVLKRRPLRLSTLAVTYFWTFGGFIQLLSVQIAREHSGEVGIGDDLANMMLVAGFGIALGSIIASLVSKRKIELGLVPVGGCIMAVSCLLMAMSTVLGVWFMIWMFISGLGAALFLVPVNAYLQDACEESERGNVIAANNLLNCFGGIVAVGVQLVLNKYFGFSVAAQFVVIAVTSLAATCYAARLLPQDVVRFVMLMLVRVVYRIRSENDMNVPKEGGVLLVPNHVSYIDAFIISAACPRPVRFLMFDEYFSKGWMMWFLKLFNTVPISRTRAKEAIMVAADAVAAGNVVCIFPEGQLTRTGSVNEIKRGFEMIARKSKCPVQPVYMDGLWGSIFSFERGKFLRKLPYRLQYGVTVVFGEPIEAKQATYETVRHSMLVLGAEAMAMRNSVLGAAKLGKRLACLVEGNPAPLTEAHHRFVKMSKDEQKEVVLNALQLADGPAVGRGKTIVVDASELGDLGPVLLHALPLLNKNKIVLVDDKVEDKDLLRWVDQYDVAAWIGGDKLWRRLDALNILQTRFSISESECEKAYPWWVVEGRVVAINMPHPHAITATQQHQAGHKEKSLGRILPGYLVNDNHVYCALKGKVASLEAHQVDEVGFVLPEPVND